MTIEQRTWNGGLNGLRQQLHREFPNQAVDLVEDKASWKANRYKAENVAVYVDSKFVFTVFVTFPR